MRKLNVALLFGGRSAEYEVSIQSAKNIYAALDKEKYNTFLIGIDKKGIWHIFTDEEFLSSHSIPKKEQVLIMNKNGIFSLKGEQTRRVCERIDVVFPIIHGSNGEDGSLQGFLRTVGLPFVGAEVLGSAIGMDKDVTKRLLRDAGVPVAKFLVFRDFQKKEISFNHVMKQIGLPFFVKPANLGSSIGVTKVYRKEEFENALALAFTYDTKVIFEEAIVGREIECSVFGNENKKASLPGEIIPHADFYSYKSKYIDPDGAVLKIPAEISQKVSQSVQELAIEVLQVLCVDGMSRVDFFLTKNNKLYVNEINTIPGFTDVSMYPKLWEASGIPYSRLVDTLITLAMDRHAKEQKLKSSL